MIVTVKTLDSETRTFTVSSESTVEEFKRQIAEAVGIPADRQRLIFKGKVLQDDHKLEECQVDGCVVHLVERRPPRTRPDGAPSATGQAGTQAPPGGIPMPGAPFNLPQLDVMGISQHIVQGIVNQLGVDTSNANVSTQQSPDGSTLNVHINLVAPAPSANDVATRISRARRFLGDARTSLNSGEGERLLSEPADMDTSSPTGETSGTESQNQDQPRPSALADLLGEMQEFVVSMQPELDRYSTLLNTQPTENLLPTDDSLPDRIAETLHNLGHAYHSLSDLTFNIRAPEPRNISMLPPLSPHVGPPQMLSQFLRGTETGLGRGTATNQQNATPRTSAPGPTPTQQPPVSTSSSTRVQIDPESSTIAFTSIVTSAVPHLVPGQPNFPQAPGGTPRSNTGATPTSQSTNATTTSSSTTGTTNSTTEGTPGHDRHARAMIDDFVAFVANFNPGGPTSQSTTPTTTSAETAQSNTQTQSQASPPRLRMNTPQVHRRLTSHPDPSVPCESFHFGPRSARSRREAQEIPQAVRDMIRSVVQRAMAQDAMEAEAARTQPQPESTSTSNAGTNTTMSSSSATQTSTPAGDSVMDSLVNLLSHIQGEGDPQLPPLLTPSNASTNQGPGNTQQGGAAINPHDLRDAVMRDLVLDAYTRASRGESQTGAYQTINDVIGAMQSRGLDTSSDQSLGIEGALLSQLITRFGTSLSIQDTLGIAMGFPQPCSRLRDVLRAYLNTDMLLGDEATDANVERMCKEFASQLLALIGPTLTPEHQRDNINVLATIRNFLEPSVISMFMMVRDNDEATFCRVYPVFMRDMSRKFVVLLSMCYQNGLQDLEHIISTRLPGTVLARDMGPVMIHTFHETVTRFVRDAYAQSANAQENLQRYIVKATPAAEATPPTGDSNLDSPTTDNVEDASLHSDDSDAFHTPPGSLATNGLDMERQVNDPGEVGMDVDEDDWKAVVPEDWVPIITQDVVRQRRIPTQQPFSDAYLSGMPPKRRKTADERAVCPTEETVPAIIRQAILATGATPKTSLDAVTSAARQNTELHDTYRDEVQKTVKRRIDNDSDFNPERFPNTRDYVEKSQPKQ